MFFLSLGIVIIIGSAVLFGLCFLLPGLASWCLGTWMIEREILKLGPKPKIETIAAAITAAEEALCGYVYGMKDGSLQGNQHALVGICIMLTDLISILDYHLTGGNENRNSRKDRAGALTILYGEKWFVPLSDSVARLVVQLPTKDDRRMFYLDGNDPDFPLDDDLDQAWMELLLRKPEQRNFILTDSVFA